MISIQEQKHPQNLDYRKSPALIPLSGKPASTPINQMFKRVVLQSPITHKSIASPRAVVPVNRIRSIFPTAKGTLLSSRPNVRALALNDIYNVIFDGIKINNQQVTTQIRPVGKNAQFNFTTKERFKDYSGNSENEKNQESHSRVKHADNAQKANPAQEITDQLKGFLNNPVVVSQIKRSAAMAKALRGGD